MYTLARDLLSYYGGKITAHSQRSHWSHAAPARRQKVDAAIKNWLARSCHRHLKRGVPAPTKLDRLRSQYLVSVRSLSHRQQHSSLAVPAWMESWTKSQMASCAWQKSWCSSVLSTALTVQTPLASLVTCEPANNNAINVSVSHNSADDSRSFSPVLLHSKTAITD